MIWIYIPGQNLTFHDSVGGSPSRYQQPIYLLKYHSLLLSGIDSQSRCRLISASSLAAADFTFVQDNPASLLICRSKPVSVNPASHRPLTFVVARSLNNGSVRGHSPLFPAARLDRANVASETLRRRRASARHAGGKKRHKESTHRQSRLETYQQDQTRDGTPWGDCFVPNDQQRFGGLFSTIGREATGGEFTEEAASHADGSASTLFPEQPPLFDFLGSWTQGAADELKLRSPQINEQDLRSDDNTL